MSAPETERGTWLATGPAAARLGITADGLRKQIRRGKCPYPVRRDNRGTWEVRVPAALATVSPDGRATVPDTRDADLAELRATVVGLQALVEAQRMHIADVRGELGDARAERDHWHALADAERQRVDRLLDRLAQPPERRRWWRWWRG